MSVSQSSSSSLSDRSRQLDGERMVGRSGQLDDCNSSQAQIRTLLEEQRQIILAECHARVSHHELQAAQAEEERRLLQGQLWRQKLEFREAHQRSLTEMVRGMGSPRHVSNRAADSQGSRTCVCASTFWTSGRAGRSPKNTSGDRKECRTLQNQAKSIQ